MAIGVRKRPEDPPWLKKVDTPSTSADHFLGHYFAKPEVESRDGVIYKAGLLAGSPPDLPFIRDLYGLPPADFDKVITSHLSPKLRKEILYIRQRELFFEKKGNATPLDSGRGSWFSKPRDGLVSKGELKHYMKEHQIADLDALAAHLKERLTDSRDIKLFLQVSIFKDPKVTGHLKEALGPPDHARKAADKIKPRERSKLPGAFRE